MLRSIIKAKPTDVAQVADIWSVNSPPSRWRRVWSQPGWRSSPPSTDQGTRPLRSPDGHSRQWLNHFSTNVPHFNIVSYSSTRRTGRGSETDFANKKTVGTVQADSEPFCHSGDRDFECGTVIFLSAWICAPSRRLPVSFFQPGSSANSV